MTTKNIFEFLKRFIDTNQYSPTVREICRELGIKSTSTVAYHLRKLEEDGYIEKLKNKNRGFKIRRNK